MKVSLVPLIQVSVEEYLELVNDPLVHKFTNPGEELETYSPAQINGWFKKIKIDETRRDYAIVLTEEQKFVGEIVVNGIDHETKSAN